MTFLLESRRDCSVQGRVFSYSIEECEDSIRSVRGEKPQGIRFTKGFGNSEVQQLPRKVDAPVVGRACQSGFLAVGRNGFKHAVRKAMPHVLPASGG